MKAEWKPQINFEVNYRLIDCESGGTQRDRSPIKAFTFHAKTNVNVAFNKLVVRASFSHNVFLWNCTISSSQVITADHAAAGAWS
jgi:hypothetical protein